jgi:hypothetical protein
MLAMKSEDPLGGYRAISAAAELAPSGSFRVAQWARVSIARVRRSRYSLDSVRMVVQLRGGVRGLLTQSYHALGEHERELTAAREARRRYPERSGVVSFEVSALAALGRIRQAQELLDTSLALPQARPASPNRVVDMPLEGFRPGKLLIAAAEEFRAHGFPEAATQALARAIAQVQGAPRGRGASLRTGQGVVPGSRRAAAEAVFRSLLADTSNFVYVGFLGTIAARRGDSITARRTWRSSIR